MDRARPYRGWVFVNIIGYGSSISFFVSIFIPFAIFMPHVLLLATLHMYICNIFTCDGKLKNGRENSRVEYGAKLWAKTFIEKHMAHM